MDQLSFDQIQTIYHNFNFILDNRITQLQTKIATLTNELSELDTILSLPPGERQQLIVECNSDLFDPRKPIKILKVNRNKKILLPSPDKYSRFDQLFKIQRAAACLKYEDQDTNTEEFDSRGGVGGQSSSSKSLIKIEDYITNKSVMLNSQEKSAEEGESIDLKQILIDPTKINYSNDSGVENFIDEESSQK